MKDQAEQLREIVARLQKRDRKENQGNARIITVTSGKGGVGKTSFTANLGICLVQMGYRVIIIDGDFGLANIDLMLGMASRHGLREIILGQMDVEEVILEGPRGIKFISGGSGIKELINLGPQQIDNFLGRIDKLNQMADIILIDTGAGAADNIVKMALAAHEVVLVVTPEPTAITDAYALTKIITSIRRDIDLRLIINRVQNMAEAEDIFGKFTKTAHRFLGVTIGTLGFIRDDLHVPKSIKEQVPYMVGYPNCDASRQVAHIAKKLTECDVIHGEQNQGLVSFFRRFLGLFNFKDG
ncbi:MAG TPA: MinD/ParA family protein [Clostridia bacterium]|nr:MinD/ParA family protein [Clostridia bacterium]